jgi:hypothetical protein
MTHDQALALSKDLAEDGFAHTIAVGIHDGMSQRVQARVDLGTLRRVMGGGIVEAVEILGVIAARHGLTLDSSLFDNGLTFNTKADIERLNMISGVTKEGGR